MSAPDAALTASARDHEANMIATCTGVIGMSIQALEPTTRERVAMAKRIGKALAEIVATPIPRKSATLRQGAPGHE